MQKVSSPAQLTEECDLLAISIIAHEEVHEERVEFGDFWEIRSDQCRMSFFWRNWTSSLVKINYTVFFLQGNISDVKG